MGLATGQQIGKYELGRLLGQGGFGQVFIAKDTELDRDVALKFMHAEHTANPEILRRFLQEARSAAKIMHPGIVTVFEASQVKGTGTSLDGIAYIAMELLHGESLADRLERNRKLSPMAAVEIVRQTASALEAAHRAGIIHRDLKPDNIYLVTDPAMPGGERVKVLDFGIAKLAQAHTSGVQTQSQMVFGTPRYMSPEQCKSAAHIDHRSDIYTLGCILFELVTGQPPFSGEVGELIAKHQLVPPPTARSLNPTVPDSLDTLIGQMLAKAPGDRPQTMQSLARTLEGGSNPGAISSGVAPTLLPDAAESLQRFTPPPGSLRMPDEVDTAKARAAVAPTTLGGASAQISGDVKRGGKRVALFAIGGLVVAAVITIVVMNSGGKQDTKTATSDLGGSAVAAPPPPPTETKPPPPKDISVEITSTPKAEVYLVADGRYLGDTPYKATRPPAEGALVFVLKAEGFKDQRVVVPANKDFQQDFALAELPKPASSGSATQVTVKKPPKPPVSKLPPVGAGTGSAKPTTKTGSSGHIEVYPEN